ncbi:TSUP family transporter [Streptomyces sp. NPDC127112]|uniref:TSUP family transporter n=1 Tax=Streptomyces sp. NPDC127112 TaxID=3345364 RepID=UPI00363C8B90
MPLRCASKETGSKGDGPTIAVRARPAHRNDSPVLQDQRLSVNRCTDVPQGRNSPPSSPRSNRSANGSSPRRSPPGSRPSPSWKRSWGSRTTSRPPPTRRSSSPVHELKRLARNAAELMILSGRLQAAGVQLELLTGPLTGIYDPNGMGAMSFAVLAVAAQLDRNYIRENPGGQAARSRYSEVRTNRERLPRCLCLKEGSRHSRQIPPPAKMPVMTTDQTLQPLQRPHPAPVVFGAGAAIGTLGGMIGLGGAEFRLPLLIGLFGFAALSAVILNKAMSLVVVLVALPARLAAVPAGEVAARWPVAVNLLAGSLLGAWAGASWAVRMRSTTLYRVLAVLMVLMAAALVLTHVTTLDTLALPLWAQIPAGVAAGLGIGVVAAIMGVAGGELLIPTIVLLFGEDIKTAGSLSLLVSLPTMLVAFARYSRDGSFAVLGANLRFTATMAAGSIAGAVLGGLLLGVFPDLVLIPALAVILLISAVKLARHH